MSMGLRIGTGGSWSLCLQADEHYDRKRGKRDCFAKYIIMRRNIREGARDKRKCSGTPAPCWFGWLDMNGSTNIADGSADASGELCAALHGSRTLESHCHSNVLSTIATPVWQRL
jgi:hypothetical protein